MPVITNSNKLRTYSTARFYQDDAILRIITGGDASAIPMQEKFMKAGSDAVKAAGKAVEAGKKAADRMKERAEDAGRKDGGDDA